MKGGVVKGLQALNKTDYPSRRNGASIGFATSLIDISMSIGINSENIGGKIDKGGVAMGFR